VRDLAVLLLHLLATVARLAGPGGVRSVVAESVLVKHQLLILNRSRKRSPNLRVSDRMVAGLCALLISPGRLIRSAIVLRPNRRLSMPGVGFLWDISRDRAALSVTLRLMFISQHSSSPAGRWCTFSTAHR